MPVLLISATVHCAGAVQGDAQDTSGDSAPALERLLEEESESGSEEVLDELERYIREPLSLHVASATELSRLPGISPGDARAILRFVAERGPIDLSELENAGLATEEQIGTLRTYTTLARPTPEAPKLKVALRARAVIDLQTRLGFRDEIYRVGLLHDPATGDSIGLDTFSLGPSYLGGPGAVMTRIDGSYGDYSAGIVFERDAGEPLFVRDTLGYARTRFERTDGIPGGGSISRFGAFTGGYLTLKREPFTAHIGDYTADFGGGLALGGSNRRYAGRGRPRGIAPHRSSEGNRYLSGAAVSMAGDPLPPGFSAAAFVSRRSLDATFGNIIESDGDTVFSVTSLRDDGYRRTWSELRRSALLIETLTGAALRYGSKERHIAFTTYRSRFRSSSHSDSTRPLDHSGLSLLAVDGAIETGNLAVRGEAARDGAGIVAGRGGIDLAHAGMNIALTAHFLPFSFVSPHAGTIGGTGSGRSNERGLSIMIDAKIAPRSVIRTSFDLARTFERTYAVPLPASESRGSLSLDCEAAPGWKLDLRIRSAAAVTATTIRDRFGRDRRAVMEREAFAVRAGLEWSSPDRRFRVRARFERLHTSYSEIRPSLDGLLTYLDLQWSPSTALVVGLRRALFQGEGNDAAPYMFEQDLPGRPAGETLAGEGGRSYIHARWRPLPGISIAAKYGETLYHDRETISPGTLQEIDGPLHGTLAVQIDVSL